MAQQIPPTLSELREQCDNIIDNLYNRTTKKAEVLKKQEAYLKKETPEEYKARKEQQAQRKVKKETPEEYTARIEYMKRKEKVELEVETQRLFDKAEKQHQNHQRYLEREVERSEREAKCEEMREKNEAYKKTPEGRLEQARIDERKVVKDEKTRNWNTPGAIREREKKQEEWNKHQQNHLDSYVARSKYNYEHKANIREGHFNVDKTMDKIDRNYKHAMSIRDNLYK
jgi:hypothetical protein